MSFDLRFLALAERLAARQIGRTGENPAVGAVLVRGGAVIGMGATADGGRPHAEKIAIEMAGDAKWAELYVTLEPCSHYGQSSPCANAVIEAGIRRVICPWQDPNPKVAGAGFARLRAAGIALEHPKIAQLSPGLAPFFTRMTLGRPMVTWKFAASMDGKIALGNGQSQWISGAETRRFTRAMRAQHQAIAVGVGTILADDPQLTTRLAGFAHDPKIVIFDRHLRTPIDAKIFENGQPVIFHQAGAENPALAQKAELIALDAKGGAGEVRAALGILAERGVNNLLLEGGATLAASFIEAGVVDEIYHVTTGALLGGDGLSALGALGIGDMNDVVRFAPKHLWHLGNDTVIQYCSDQLDPRDFLARSTPR